MGRAVGHHACMTAEFGDAAVVSWIRESTPPGLTIGSAVPPGFARYATIVIPDDETRPAHDRALVERCREHAPSSSRWWLGYLETGGTPIPFPDAPRVTLYSGWQYVLVHARPEEALTLREDYWDRTLPEVFFPDDRSWLVSTLWDDDWRCVGGPASLIDSLRATAALETRVVDLTEDATPPGHTAF